MRGMWAVVANIALTALCWGVYGPVLHHGQADLKSRLLPFICVGVAYFVIAVVVPLIALQMFGEVGKWTKPGTLWSLAAGAAGAIGALGIIMAFEQGGKPVYVMPLVFGCAPVVNTLFTMFMSKTFKEVNPKFLAGLVMVLAGAVMVLMYKPSAGGAKAGPAVPVNMMLVTFFVGATALAWGVYGPVLHKGQATMSGSKLRPLMCVGISYFVIAVLIPVGKLLVSPEGVFDGMGITWSLAAGAAGAIGALGIILAFNFGGKPVYVMPLVFGCAPVVNSFTEIFFLYKAEKLGTINPIFFGALLLVAAGAVTVLIFAPRPSHKPAAAPVASSAKPAEQPA